MEHVTRKYERPAVRRFTPSELDRRAMCMHWLNTDALARLDIEDGGYFDTFVSGGVDRHGYPTA